MVLGFQVVDEEGNHLSLHKQVHLQTIPREDCVGDLVAKVRDGLASDGLALFWIVHVSSDIQDLDRGPLPDQEPDVDSTKVVAVNRDHAIVAVFEVGAVKIAQRVKVFNLTHGEHIGVCFLNGQGGIGALSVRRGRGNQVPLSAGKGYQAPGHDELLVVFLIKRQVEEGIAVEQVFHVKGGQLELHDVTLLVQAYNFPFDSTGRPAAYVGWPSSANSCHGRHFYLITGKGLASGSDEGS